MNTNFMFGGKGDRHFRVVKMEGKNVSLGGVSITDKASPGDAARKLLKSIAHEKGLEKMKKLNMGKVSFSIQEYTQGSKKKYMVLILDIIENILLLNKKKHQQQKEKLNLQ